MKFIDKIEIKNGIIIGIYKSNLSINLEDAKEMVEERLAFQKGIDYPIVIHLNGIKTSSKEARIYMAAEGIKGITIGAFIARNTVERIILNFFLSIEKPPIPAKAFTNQEDAVKWINDIRTKTQTHDKDKN